ncbi:MAG: hypothetical protein PVH36_01630 [Desulfobacterales bacterium]
MRNVYLSYENIPYFYNIKSNKLYELMGEYLQEVDGYRIIQNVRFNSNEISRREAMLMVKNNGYIQKQLAT